MTYWVIELAVLRQTESIVRYGERFFSKVKSAFAGWDVITSHVAKQRRFALVNSKDIKFTNSRETFIIEYLSEEFALLQYQVVKWIVILKRISRILAQWLADFCVISWSCALKFTAQGETLSKLFIGNIMKHTIIIVQVKLYFSMIAHADRHVSNGSNAHYVPRCHQEGAHTLKMKQKKTFQSKRKLEFSLIDTLTVRVADNDRHQKPGAENNNRSQSVPV